MTIYAETSAVLRWLFGEKGAADIVGHLRAADKVVTSRLTWIETHRVVRRAEREQRIGEAGVAEILAAFSRAAAHWALLELTRDVAERAAEAFPVEPVRTLDAIHLASALFLRRSLSDLALLSTDERIRGNGARLGFQILPA
jgi:predicted nucleic acid-binding protein